MPSATALWYNSETFFKGLGRPRWGRPVFGLPGPFRSLPRRKAWALEKHP